MLHKRRRVYVLFSLLQKGRCDRLQLTQTNNQKYQNLFSEIPSPFWCHKRRYENSGSGALLPAVFDALTVIIVSQIKFYTNLLFFSIEKVKTI